MSPAARRTPVDPAGSRACPAWQEFPLPVTDTVRFVLVGDRPPPLAQAPEVGERARRAALGQARRLYGPDHIPVMLSGHGRDGPVRGHRHAFWLSEDEDGDGLVDHLTVHVPGMDDATLAALLTVSIGVSSPEESWRAERQWSGRSGDLGDPDALGAPGVPGTPGAPSAPSAPDAPGRLFGSAHAWTSITPYVGPWHQKPRLTQPDMLRRECGLRGLPPLAEVFPLDGGARTRPEVRWRWRGSTPPGPGRGALWRLVFDAPVSGPLALGYGCHFGLGLFGRERADAGN